ncbi:MAG: 16S rRNA (cytidine(1402)-2'-O)-methyltransferase [Deltaproteobacteria bacterium]|nr:MAG: 16S rRNA (cytidine(1402)-2'-O)-methyltransferase [Deltaproteobacteria bacterium]
MVGTLYVVATPIGNLEDITLRALRVLKEVDVIAAEDTRHTQILLNHYGIRTPLTSYHEHNEKTKARQLMSRLERGEQIALVSDAGTPAISDPGYRLAVEAIRGRIPVIPIPGASALTAVLSAGGLPTDRFVFDGFLPAKKQERRARLRALSSETGTLVIYEAPHRLTETLNDLAEILGDREIVLAREVSKVHEEFLRGRLTEVAKQVAGREIKGELTLLIGGSRGQSEVSQEQIEEEIRKLKDDGLRVKEIAEILGEKYGYSKKEIYRLALAQSGRTTI